MPIVFITVPCALISRRLAHCRTCRRATAAICPTPSRFVVHDAFASYGHVAKVRVAGTPFPPLALVGFALLGQLERHIRRRPDSRSAT